MRGRSNPVHVVQENGRAISARGAALVFGILVVLAATAVTWRRVDDSAARAIAASETRMWKAYYQGDSRRLGMELFDLLRSQFGLTASQAMAVAEPLARAAMAFEDSLGDYESSVLPHLERAYGALREASRRSFDVSDVARAELSWWVARRTPGQDSPEEVGHRIALLYAALFGAPKPEFEEAGLLRARAALIRDRGGKNCDWAQVESLLVKSYQ